MKSPDTITELYRRHAAVVFRRARQILGSDPDAHEVVQEIFLSLVERPGQFQGRSSMTTFLYAMSTHACLNRIRNQNNRSRLEQQSWAGPGGEQEDGRLSAEQRLILHQAVRQMPDELANAAIYHFVDGLTHQEISEILGCSRRHVGDLLARISDWGEEKPSC